MIIGVPKEIKTGEQRVALTPAGVQDLVAHGHRVLIEPGAGTGSGFRDEDYTKEGASLEPVDAVWAQAELILKVKEPIRVEYPRLRSEQILFTYLHLAAVPDLTRALQKSGTIAHRVRDGAARRREPAAPDADERGGGPAGGAGRRLPPGQGARRARHPALRRPRRAAGQRRGARRRHGRPERGRMAVGLGGDVSVLDVNVDRLRHVDDLYRGQVVTVASNAFNIARLAPRATSWSGAVLVAGARAPILVPESTVKTMKEGSVIVDVAVDQGGCVETMHPTTLADPIYLVHGVVHYGVANMPALVPRTSTFALTNVTLPYIVELAGKGVAAALRGNPALAKGLNVSQGRIVHPGVAEAVGEKATPLESVLA